jgi:hypothetical protein
MTQHWISFAAATSQPQAGMGDTARAEPRAGQSLGLKSAIYTDLVKAAADPQQSEGILNRRLCGDRRPHGICGAGMLLAGLDDHAKQAVRFGGVLGRPYLGAAWGAAIVVKVALAEHTRPVQNAIKFLVLVSSTPARRMAAVLFRVWEAEHTTVAGSRAPTTSVIADTCTSHSSVEICRCGVH